MATKNKITTRKFCGVDLDITEFENTFPYNQQGQQDHSVYSSFNTASTKTEFLGYEWFYIGDEPDDSHIFDNKEVKSTGTIESDVDGIAYDFRMSGYDVSKFPAVIDQYNKFRNGRTRNKASRKNKQDYVPVAKFKFISDNDVLSTISTSSIANSSAFHKHQHRNDTKDYENQGVAAVEDGGLKRDLDAIKDWFIHETNFELDLDVSKWLTKVASKVFERTAFEFSLVNHDIDNEKFCSDYKIVNLKYQGKIALYKAKNGMKFFNDKVKSSGGNPPPTMLYTDAYSPEKCGEMVYSFISELKKHHKDSYRYVSNTSIGKTYTYIDNEPVKLEDAIPDFNTDFILGVIPNLDRGFQQQLLVQGSLISVEDYIKDSGFKTKKKRTEYEVGKALGVLSKKL